MNNINMEDVKKIEFNYDNIDVLKCIKYLIGVVVNDINYMNDTSDINNDTINYLDLGNNTFIKKEDFESLCSIMDTISFIEKYNTNKNN